MTAPTTWTQLTFTSADNVAGRRGGWGVKAESAGADQADLDLLRQGVTAQLEDVEPMPKFPSANDLERRTRRLRYDVVGDRSCLWHAVAAGQDATGRPGNVFNHAAATASFDRSRRPIEFWRSPDWLTPFGPLESAAAQLPDALRPGTHVTRESVVEFIREGDRLYALEWLLAAVDHALALPARFIVLQTNGTDDAAMWLGAISFLMSSAQARDLTFVTFERMAGLEAGSAGNVRVVCVPPGELDTIDVTGALYLNPTSVMEEGSESWTGGGQTFARSPRWQEAALDALAAADPVAVLEGIDDLTHDLRPPDVATLPRWWPLLAALLTAPDEPVGDRETRVVACLESCPSAIAGHPKIQALVDEVGYEGVLGRALASRLAANSPLRSDLELRAAQTFLRRDWRTGVEPPPGPRSEEDEAALAPIAAVAAAEALASSEGNSEAMPGEARALLGFVHHYGLLLPESAGPGRADLAARVAAALESMLPRRRRDAGVVLGKTDPSTTGPAPTGLPEAAAPPPSPFAPPASPFAPLPVGLLEVDAEPSAPAAAVAPVSGLEASMRALLMAQAPGSGEARVAAHALVLVQGVAPLPLRDGGPGLLRTAAQVADLLAAAKTAEESDVLVGWLTCFYALSESGCLGDVESTFFQGPHASYEPALARNYPSAAREIGRFLRKPREVSGPVLAMIIMRQSGRAPRNSVLGYDVGGVTLGWLAVRMVWKDLQRGVRDRLTDAAAERLKTKDLQPAELTRSLDLVRQMREGHIAAPARSGP